MTFWVKENVLIRNVYVFVFLPMQSPNVTFNVFLQRKGHREANVPGGCR